ncbi:MAG: hypothetical protein A2637_05610 [Candidatus Muproteobacteria bacterium RIFCSPHIGHO2_01_FULL_65_16]|uniref:Uncharacterized protein n=2 Tax=Candidatus Muproteobacteria TaxID=1817795 RepID=A0A1F6TPR6_9PROT|nr:MAG: hypothetical protein A2637_05610 [Candidatus Muproteobacteria bacterium RIFCSPHIGHO2_01_FULL_65_16]OGI48268.1 MAG: hypothetical protein A3B81_06210 [Candidatus Muproteobacteria bacterium RIFCSPHIGHO2_02_FULL_65_16]
MIGKKNIVFGFFYLVLTAALGPVMIAKHFDARKAADTVKQEKLGALQTAAESGFEVNLKPMKPIEIDKVNADAILALSARLNAQAPIDATKGGPHAHGNLEALLNIVVGVVLMFLAVPAAFKQAISWIFIAGALLHSGLLYLTIALGLPWAGAILGSWFGPVGPILILLGLALTGVAAVMGFRGRLVED